MSSDKELLNRILSGDFSPDELAGNPILVSLAERVYGIKIDPVKLTKPRDFVEPELATEITEVAPPTDMLIEVIGNIAPAIPVANMNLPPLAIPPVVEVKKKTGMRNLVLAGFGFVILNLFGVWSYVLGSLCQSGDLCPADGYTRINLMDIYKVNTGYGWSEPVQSGAFGIPDIVAVVVLSITLFALLRK
ncbi:MAG TPA: hypothetical protein QF401_06120 [Candidatus Poseidoniaceae archaeon]|nr:hypothetical protein [Candidatus Poseidoniaceae archaeon]